MGSLKKTMPRKARKTLALATVPKGTKLVTLSQSRLTAPKRKNRKRSIRNRKRGRTLRRSLSSQLTPAGVGFLKCSMAPADFMKGGTQFVGIPDEFSGQTIHKQHEFCGALTLGSTGTDNYIMMLPVPGVAYWYGSRAAGSTSALTLTAVNYGDAGSMFPAGSEDKYVNNFRYASNVIEIINATNDMTWSGIIQAWKSKVTIAEAIDTTLVGPGYASVKVWEGFNTLNGNEPTYVAAVKDGCYMPAFNSDENFDFSEILMSAPYAEINVNTSGYSTTDGFITLTGSGGLNFPGLGNLEATIIKLPAIAASQSFEVRTWACVEYQVPNTSPFYDFAVMSPLYDPLALELYKQYRKRVPAAVSVAHNASFWATFVDWVEKAAGLASYIPGPVGSIASGVQSVIGGIRGLL